MGLVARRDLQRRCLHFDEVPCREPSPQRRADAVASQQQRPPVGMNIGPPKAWILAHIYLVRPTCRKHWHLASGWVWCGPNPRFRAAPSSRIAIVKVIASQLRKGNIVDIDGKLYVVLNAESFHPGKGTPTTQIDMRRISDGVKTQMRYKTTDQVERAHVEEVEYSYLYQDGDGFHFMNDQTYDQVALQADIVGDMAAYLQEGMKVQLAIHEGLAISLEIPQKVTLEITETEPAMKGQTASGSFKPAILSNGVRTMVPTHIVPGTRVVVMTADGSYVERAKD
jgi:elongation factor P